MSTSEKLLEDEGENGLTKFNPRSVRRKQGSSLQYEGIAYHLLVNPDPVSFEDKKLSPDKKHDVNCFEEENIYL